MERTYCSLCGSECLPTHFYDAGKTKPLDTGYGLDRDNKPVCYSCCAKSDAEALRTLPFGSTWYGYYSAKHILSASNRYLLGHGAMLDGLLSNWPGSFELRIPGFSASRSVNNFGAERIDFHFSYAGNNYWGYNIGDNQIARVRRIKE